MRLKHEQRGRLAHKKLNCSKDLLFYRCASGVSNSPFDSRIQKTMSKRASAAAAAAAAPAPAAGAGLGGVKRKSPAASAAAASADDAKNNKAAKLVAVSKPMTQANGASVVAVTTDPDVAIAQRNAVLSDRIERELGSDDSKADTVDNLRTRIAELDERPILEHLVKTSADHPATAFARDLAVPLGVVWDDPTYALIPAKLCDVRDTHDERIIRARALELALLLRLFVALGGSLNTPCVYEETAANTQLVTQKSLDDAGKQLLPGQRSISVIIAKIDVPDVALAVAMAACRLKIDWETPYYPMVGRPVRTAPRVFWDAALETPRFFGRVLAARILHVVGEAAACFALPGTHSLMHHAVAMTPLTLVVAAAQFEPHVFSDVRYDPQWISARASPVWSAWNNEYLAFATRVNASRDAFVPFQRGCVIGRDAPLLPPLWLIVSDYLARA
jgi:hypothetical protein